MGKLSNIKVIREFTNDGITYGVYVADFSGREKQIFIRNGDSVGAVSFYLGKPASKCVDEIRDDVKQELFEKLDEMKAAQ